MDRRRFLREGVLAGGLVAGGGVYLFSRRGKARAEVTSQLLDEALPPLQAGALQELKAVPVRAREEIRRYFLGKCLNVEGFVSHLCSPGFGDLLGRCRTPEEREACFLRAFCARVCTEAEMLNQVRVIASEVGSELDTAWDAYSHELSGRWNTRLQPHGPSLAVGELINRLEPIIRGELSRAARLGVTGNQAPAVGQTIGKIGQSAILLLPVMQFGPPGLKVGIAVFIALAARHIWDHVMARLEDHRGDSQAAISAIVAQLGNRVGAEFKREVRLRLNDLHTWQEQSVRQTALRLAEERVTLI